MEGFLRGASRFISRDLKTRNCSVEHRTRWLVCAKYHNRLWSRRSAIQRKPHDPLAGATADTAKLAGAACAVVRSIWKYGYRYKKAGVILLTLPVPPPRKVISGRAIGHGSPCADAFTNSLSAPEGASVVVKGMASLPRARRAIGGRGARLGRAEPKPRGWKTPSR